MDISLLIWFKDLKNLTLKPKQTLKLKQLLNQLNHLELKIHKLILMEIHNTFTHYNLNKLWHLVSQLNTKKLLKEDYLIMLKKI